MQALMRLKRRLSSSNFNLFFRPSSSSLHSSASAHSTATNSFTAPWSTIQRRGIKVAASDVRVGNIIGKQGRIFEVLKVEHSHEGRGKATIKKDAIDLLSDSGLSGAKPVATPMVKSNKLTVELRDIDQGTKVTQRLGTGEDIERVYVQEKTFMYMCMDQDGTVVLMDPNTLDQIEVSKDLFGKNCLYIQDGMKVKIQFYDDKPLSASVPKRVTCTVKEVIAATPRNKKVVLVNGLTVEVPTHVVAGDAIVVNTEDDSYIERAKA